MKWEYKKEYNIPLEKRYMNNLEKDYYTYDPNWYYSKKLNYDDFLEIQNKHFSNKKEKKKENILKKGFKDYFSGRSWSKFSNKKRTLLIIWAFIVGAILIPFFSLNLFIFWIIFCIILNALPHILNAWWECYKDHNRHMKLSPEEESENDEDIEKLFFDNLAEFKEYEKEMNNELKT